MCARADQRDTINLTVHVAKKKQILVPGARQGPNVYPLDSNGWRRLSAQLLS
jgi:hypothetical protein